MSKNGKKLFSLGADPEIFVVKGNGELFPAFTFLPSKYDPVKTDEPGGGSVYWDGAQCEFTIKPSTNIPEVLTSISFGMRKVLEMARCVDPKARLTHKTVFDTPTEWLATLAPEFVEFGCMPSFNVYGIEGMKADGKDVAERWSGGHIHLGCGRQSEQSIARVVKALDVLLAVPFVSMFANFEEGRRRRYYGLAGEHRKPPHGIEYRVLSSLWLANPKLGADTFDLARRITNYALAGGKIHKADDSEVIETVLLCDVEKARQITDRNKKVYEEIDFKSELDFLKPIEQQMNMTDIEANWGIL